MPKIPAKSQSDVDALASEICACRPFKAAGVVPWLRANLDLMMSLRSGCWIPGDQRIVLARGKWTHNDIARALVKANVTFRTGRLTGPVLKSRLADLAREAGVVRGLGPLEAIKRVVFEALDERQMFAKSQTSDEKAFGEDPVTRSGTKEISTESKQAALARPAAAEMLVLKDAGVFERFRQRPAKTPIDMTDHEAVAKRLEEVRRENANGKKLRG